MPVKVAAVQFHPRLLAKEENLTRILSYIKLASKEGSELVVFPECSLTGYGLSSLEETSLIAEPIPGESSGRIMDLCKDEESVAVVGMVEEDGQNYYNTALIAGPDGFIGKYRKTHLPHQGLDRFMNKGDQPFQIYEHDGMRIGLIICYDSLFPEPSRVLSLKGADLIVLPTNWARGVEFYYRYIIPTRAIENHVNYVAVNRVGLERGFEFYGKSLIVAFDGKIIAEGSRREEILYGDVDIHGAREKHIVRIPEEWEVNILEDRRPDLYSEISLSK